MERIPLSNAAFEGDNNAYLFADGPETALVDTGDWTGGTRDQLEAELGDRGVSLADIDRVLLTHWHADHAGLAGAIQSESGAAVHVHEADAPLVAGEEAAWAEMQDRQARYFEQWGIPESGRATLREFLLDPATTGSTPEVTAFEDGDRFVVNGRTLEVVHASGHAAGLCLFELENGEVLSGDALLPEYTPNVGGADVRVEDALAKYLSALDGIVGAEYSRAWPGHRDPIDDPAGRAAQILDHHEERAWRVLEALRRHGPCDPWTVSAELFGDLDGIHILHGPGEAYAHLDHLERAGSVVGSGTEYRLTDDTAAALDGRGDRRWPLDR
jgi:glyoxylase-like metal-dependent hydrolase (beta-lactamase superfamily II)